MEIFERKCKGCNNTFLLEDMASAGMRNGVQYYRYWCKPCYYKEKTQHKKSKRQWFINYKKELYCNRCGFSDYRALVFHHIDPTEKEIALGNAIRLGWAIDRMKKEIDKCEVLCANCHSIEHHVPEIDV